ncbi:MAG: hypothetical protein ACRCTY_00830, partial [Candidatus Adiutrix sp.]
LTAFRLNQNYGRKQVAMFELGVTFLTNGPQIQPDEKETIGGIWGGQTGAGHWNDPERPIDFWDIKGVVETLGHKLNLNLVFSRQKDMPPWYDQGEAAMVHLSNGDLWGHLGRLNKKALKAFALKEHAGPIYLFELDAEAIIKHGFAQKPFTSWSKFPQVDRDMALILDKNISADTITQAIKADCAIPLTGLNIFDLYEGDPLPKDKKSLAFRLTFQTSDRTLTDEEVNGYFQTITEKLSASFQASLRT